LIDVSVVIYLFSLTIEAQVDAIMKSKGKLDENDGEDEFI
jgi:hypothetical protein